MIAVGTRFGHLVVLLEMSGEEAGAAYGEGYWCRVKCDCGARGLKRSRHLRAGGVRTHGRFCPLRRTQTPEGAAKGWATRRERKAQGVYG